MKIEHKDSGGMWLMEIDRDERTVSVTRHGENRIYDIPEPIERIEFDEDEGYVFVYIDGGDHYGFKFEAEDFLVGDKFGFQGDFEEVFACHTFGEDRPLDEEEE